MKYQSRAAIDERWHRIDSECAALADICPPKAREHIATAATRIFQADDYGLRGDKDYFLRQAKQEMFQAERLMKAKVA